MSTLPKIDPAFKSLIPALSKEEREQLEQNILQARKCHDAIILWDGVIIDGHNRYEICVKHGIEFEVVDLPLTSREEAIVWILDNQLGRRNINAAARIELALAKTEMLREKAQRNLTRGGRPKNGAEKPSAKLTKPEIESFHVRKALADDVGISERTLHNYLQIKEHGSSNLLAKVQSGELKIGAAHKLLTKEILKQLKQADEFYASMADAISPQTARLNGTDINCPVYKANKQAIQTRLAQLSVTLQEQITKLDERSAHDKAKNHPGI